MSARQVFDLGLLLAACAAAGVYVAGFSVVATVAVGAIVAVVAGIVALEARLS